MSLEETLRRSELADAFDAGMICAIARLAKSEHLAIMGKPAELVWTEGAPHERLLAGFIRGAEERAARYEWKDKRL